MKFAPSPTRRTERASGRRQSGFTLAEVLAALLFMAIVIPVAIEGLHIATLAGEVADRKSHAARVAERLLNESLVTTNWNKTLQTGTVAEQEREYRWTLRNETWSQNGTANAPRQLSVEVTYTVQGKDYTVRLSTLSPSAMQ